MEKRYQLPKEFVEKWVSALRSGKYKQGKGSYFDKINDCYCSMGVGIVANNMHLNFRGDNVLGEDPYMEVLSNDERKRSLWFQIMALNDENNWSFLQIADWIEANVELI